MAEFKAFAAIEVVKGESKYTFLLPNGASFGEVYEAVLEVEETLLKEQQKALEARRPQPAKEEEVKPEVPAETPAEDVKA